MSKISTETILSKIVRPVHSSAPRSIALTFVHSKLAERYDNKPWQKQLTARVTTEIQSQLNFILGRHTNNDEPPTANVRRDLRLLDYACGTGMITRALGSRCSEAVGIDISSSMIDQYQKLAESYPIPGLRTSAVVGNLFTEQPPSTKFNGEGFYNFDVAAVGFGFHHFSSQGMCIRRLTERLKPGGTIFIVDFCADGEKLPMKAGATAHGFDEDTMKELLESEGLLHVGYHRILGEFEMHMEDRAIKKSVFLARASKVS